MMCLTLREIIFITIFANLIASEKPCNVQDEWYNYLKDLVKTFVNPMYQDLDCLAVVIYGVKHNTKCKFSTFARPLEDNGCRYIRNIHRSEKKHFDDIIRANVQVMSTSLYANDIDIDELCVQLQDFNAKPTANRSKEKYADIYNTTANNLAVGYALAVVGSIYPAAENFKGCVRAVNELALKFFGISDSRWNSPTLKDYSNVD